MGLKGDQAVFQRTRIFLVVANPILKFILNQSVRRILL